MGIQEFRGGGLLRYGFEQLLGVEDITAVPNLTQALADLLVSKEVISNDELSALRQKLGAKMTSTCIGSQIAESAECVSSVYYNLAGIPVAGNNLPSGIYLRCDVMSDGQRHVSRIAVK
ncbi:MAG: hypothetical protein K2F74_01665 [Muribaculaceae bacterium]|nr:hypothetical protein [Muribaculaceae bacterium]